MPVAQRGGNGARQLAILAFATLAGLGAMVFLVTQAPQLGGSDRIDLQLGDEVFEAGKAEDTADFIAEQGPWLMPDLIADRDRDVILQHVGDDPNTGWHAFAARPLDAPRDCFLQWQVETRNFIDNCTGIEYDETGSGLVSYPVSVDADGFLTVDINASERDRDAEDEPGG